MECTTGLICLISTISGRCKNALGRGSTSNRHITKLEQSRFSLDIYDANWLACLVGPLALSAHLPCRPTCLFGVPALSAHLPCRPNCLDGLPVLSSYLPA
jgi:hypothetical protein